MSGADVMDDAPMDTRPCENEEAEHAKLSNMYMQAMQAKCKDGAMGEE